MFALKREISAIHHPTGCYFQIACVLNQMFTEVLKVTDRLKIEHGQNDAATHLTP